MESQPLFITVVTLYLLFFIKIARADVTRIDTPYSIDVLLFWGYN